MMDSYDGKDHKIWNSSKGDIVEVRKIIREHYLREQDFRCAYCRMQKKEKNGLTWDIEHILPKSVYPEYLFEPENLAIACKECNNPKDDLDTLSVELKSPVAYPVNPKDYKIIHPHYDKYSENIEIVVIEGKRLYIPLNGEKGKFTIIACNLLRFSYDFGEWESFDEATVLSFSDFLDNCPPDASIEEIKRMLGHLRFSLKNTDF